MQLASRIAAQLIAILLAMAAPAMAASAGSQQLCKGEPIRITEHCHDPRFNQPVIDVKEVRDAPVPHTYVNGHFAGTDARFSFYFPLTGYEGRFFQFTHQLNTSENGTEVNIRFALDNGGYLVQTNMGGVEAARTVEATLFEGLRPDVVGYRVNAAAAKYSRQVAADIFGKHRPYGYLTGGSGGSYQTIASMQNTTVWDGATPFVMPTPQATPNVYTARIHALRVLRDGPDGNVFPAIMDAINPGGSGNPYATLNQEQREALREATRMGFPLRGWFEYASMTVGALRLVAAYNPYLDPEYFEDYWNVPGYLGYDDPYGSVAAALIEHDTTVSFVAPAGPGAWAIGLATTPGKPMAGADLFVNSGAASGKQFSVFQTAGPSTLVVLSDASRLAPGDQVTLNNRDYLALQTYHRHQFPDLKRYAKLADPREHFPTLPKIFPPMPAWDQFADERGKPIYPQREVLLGPVSAFNGAGSLQTGHFHGKMLGMQSMVDIDAFPWKADWYRQQIHAAGNGHRYRLYYIDHAEHTGNVTGARQAHLISYRGALEQILLDLAAWVEEGVEPPKETRYWMQGAQVMLPARASARRGIQPVVHLKANGGDRAVIAAGGQVRFSARVEVPQNVGRIVQVEWDFLGTGEFAPAGLGRIRPGTVTVSAAHTYAEPGTYFPVLRVTSHRQADPSSIHARVQNIGRVRVVVN